MTETLQTQDADKGVSVWVVGVVVLLGIVLLALPLWWVLDTYVFAEGADEVSEAPAVGTTQSTVSADEGADLVNLALRKPVIGTGPGADPSSRLVDGDPTTSWNSGGFPPQIAEIDLGESSTIHSIRILTGQSPAGDTKHGIFGWRLGESEPEVLHVFEGYTTDRQWLSYTTDSPWEGIDRVGVVTAASPSWVAWYEIEVIGTSP